MGQCTPGGLTCSVPCYWSQELEVQSTGDWYRAFLSHSLWEWGCGVSSHLCEIPVGSVKARSMHPKASHSCRLDWCLLSWSRASTPATVRFPPALPSPGITRDFRRSICSNPFWKWSLIFSFSLCVMIILEPTFFLLLFFFLEVSLFLSCLPNTLIAYVGV